MQSKRIAAFGAAALCALFVSTAQAAYPEPGTPVRIVVGFPPGGGADVLARAAALGVSKALNTNVMVENRPGASGIIATDYVARAKPDGYTLYIATPGSLTILPSLQKVPYNPAKDFTPISLLVTMPNVLVTSPKSGINSVKDLIERAKTKDVTYASGGNGTIGQMAAEQFNMMAGLHMRHIPYKGTTPALTDVAGGLVEVTFSDPSVKSLVQAGKLKALGVTTVTPSPEFPDAPPIGQAGIPGYELTNWYGVIAPAGVPHDIVETLNRAFAQAMANPDIVKQLAASGMTATSNTPAQFGELLTKERAKWADLVKKADIHLD